MDRLEARILAILEENRQEIYRFAEDIWRHPELGYKETYTAGRIAQAWRALGLPVREGLALTGVRADLVGNAPEDAPCVALVGELDAIRCPHHPQADPVTGAAHACGHNGQLTGVFGAALALNDPEVRAALSGRVALVAAPAEEYGELEFKGRLIEEGKIGYGGGKAELVRTGALDGVDMAVVHHTHYAPSDADLLLGNAASNGCLSKLIRVHGRPAHAAAAPHRAINALSAASVGLSALGMLRETFRDEDTVRVHPILTRGGDLVNVVPGEAVLETLVRANNIEAMLDASEKTDRAFRGGALAFGAGLTIVDEPGYLPVRPMAAQPWQLEIGRLALPQGRVEALADRAFNAASTDVGDLSHLMPCLNFTTGGAVGALHSAEYQVTDPEVAYLLPAKMMALSAYRLLRSGAALARQTLESFTPALSRAQYLAYMDSCRARHAWDGEGRPVAAGAGK